MGRIAIRRIGSGLDRYAWRRCARRYVLDIVRFFLVFMSLRYTSQIGGLASSWDRLGWRDC